MPRSHWTAALTQMKVNDDMKSRYEGRQIQATKNTTQRTLMPESKKPETYKMNPAMASTKDVIDHS